IMSRHSEIKNNSRLDRRGKTHRHELLGASQPARFSEHATRSPDLSIEMAPQSLLTLFTQAPRAFLADGAVDLRHTRRRSAGPWRKRKDVQLRQSAFVDHFKRPVEHVLVLSGKTGDDVGAEGNVRSQSSHLLAESDRIATRMPPLHA